MDCSIKRRDSNGMRGSDITLKLPFKLERLGAHCEPPRANDIRNRLDFRLAQIGPPSGALAVSPARHRLAGFFKIQASRRRENRGPENRTLFILLINMILVAGGGVDFHSPSSPMASVSCNVFYNRGRVLPPLEDDSNLAPRFYTGRTQAVGNQRNQRQAVTPKK